MRLRPRKLLPVNEIPGISSPVILGSLSVVERRNAPRPHWAEWRAVTGSARCAGSVTARQEDRKVSYRGSPRSG